MRVRLDNGSVLRLRRIRPEDRDALAAGVRALSAETLRRRFLAPRTRLTTSELRYLTEVDFTDHYAMVAVDPAAPGDVLAVGRWVRDPAAPHAAEMAIVVCDGLQGQGLGTALGIALARAALARGITRFTASILPDNAPAQRLFAHLSRELHRRVGSGVIEVEADLAA